MTLVYPILETLSPSLHARHTQWLSTLASAKLVKPSAFIQLRSAFVSAAGSKMFVKLPKCLQTDREREGDGERETGDGTSRGHGDVSRFTGRASKGFAIHVHKQWQATTAAGSGHMQQAAVSGNRPVSLAWHGAYEASFKKWGRVAANSRRQCRCQSRRPTCNANWLYLWLYEMFECVRWGGGIGERGMWCCKGRALQRELWK